MSKLAAINTGVYNVGMTDINTTEATAPATPVITRWVDEVPAITRRGRPSQYDAVLNEVRSYGPTDKWAEIDTGLEPGPASNKMSTLKARFEDIEFCQTKGKIYARLKGDSETAAA